MKDSPVLSDSELGNLFCARKLDCDRMLYMAGSREILRFCVKVLPGVIPEYCKGKGVRT